MKSRRQRGGGVGGPETGSRSGWLASAAPVVILVGVLAGAPLAIAPGVSFYFDVTPKVVLLLLGVAFAVLLPSGGSIVTGVRRLYGSRWGRVLLLLLAAQALSLSVSTAFSSQPDLSVTGTNWRRMGWVTQAGLLLFTFVTACCLAANPGRLTAILRAVTLAGSAAALYGVLQYFGFDPVLASETYHIGEGEWTIVRPPGALGHAGYFATYLLYVTFLAGAMGRTDPHPAWRYFGMAAAALGSVSVILTGTRSAILGLAAGAGFLWFWFRPRFTRRAGLASVALAVAFAGFYYSPLGEKMRARTRWYLEDAGGGGRLWLWRDSLRMGMHHWAAGAGVETFSSQFPRFQSAELARAFPNRYYPSAHNAFLDAFADQGLPGLLALLGFVAAALAAARNARTDQAGRAAYVAGGLAAAVTSNQFLGFTLPTALYFYVCAALLVAMAEFPPGRAPAAAPRWLWALRFPAGAGLIVFAAQLAMADRGMVIARRHAEAGRVESAVQAYQGILRAKPAGMDTDLWYSRLMAAAAEDLEDPRQRQLAWRAAKEAAERSVTACDNCQNAYYNLAAFLAAENDAPRTEASLRKAIALAPNWYKPRWVLARLLRQTGRIEEAEGEARRAAELNGGHDPEVADTWEQLRSEARLGGR